LLSLEGAVGVVELIVVLVEAVLEGIVLRGTVKLVAVVHQVKQD